MPIIKPSREFEGSDVSSDASSLGCYAEYVAALNWGPGERDQSAWNAFLRAGSLGIDGETAAKIVTDYIHTVGGTFSPAKIRSQIRRAYEHVGSKNDAPGFICKAPKTEFSADKLKSMAAKVPGVHPELLQALSPVATDAVSSAQFLEHLYKPGEKVVVFVHYESQGQLLYEVGAPTSPTLPEGGPCGVWFLVNPVDGQFHPNPRQADKQSRRSEESVTSWRYLVLESDVAETNEWLSCLVQLPLKIAAIYTSGGKSIHALVRIDAVSKKQWDHERDAMKHIVVTLGADANAMTAVRLSRLPATRRGEATQHLLYLDPDPDGTPIISKGTTRNPS